MQNPPIPPQKPACHQIPPAPLPAQIFCQAPKTETNGKGSKRRGRAQSIRNQREQEGPCKTGAVFGGKGPLGMSRRQWWGQSSKWPRPRGAPVTLCGVGSGTGKPNQAQLPAASPSGPAAGAPLRPLSPASGLGRAGCSSAPPSLIRIKNPDCREEMARRSGPWLHFLLPMAWDG